MEGQKPADSSRWRRGSQGRKRSSTHDAQRLPQEMIGDPWPVTRPSGRKDTVFEAAQVLVRARNAVVVNECSNAITLLPASGSVPGFQGGSCDTPLYSLRSPRLEPFRVHIWQNPAVRQWNRITLSWDVTPGRIMVRHGLKSQQLTHLLKTLGVAKADAKMSDLCNHFRCWRSLSTRKGWLNEYSKDLRGLVYQRWWSFNGFRFLELPPELRELILTFAMGSIAIPFAANVWPTRRYAQLATPNMRLSYVSKQLNREVNAALFAHTTFYFHAIHQLLRAFPCTEERSRKAFRPLKKLRSLELDLSPRELLRVFGVSLILGVHIERSSTFYMGTILDGGSPICHRIRIRIRHIFENNLRPNPNHCQKVHNLAFWAGARALLRNIAVVELIGHIDETQKKEFLAEHALERKGVITEANDFAGWQRGIWSRW